MGTVKGTIEAVINREKTRASLLFTPQTPGEVWTMQKVLDLLEKKGVTYGIDREAIAGALKAFGEARGETTSPAIAKGVEPKTSTFSFTLMEKALEPNLKAVMAPVVRRAGPPRFKKKVSEKIERASYFAKGEKIGTLEFHDDALPGTSVFGRELPSGDVGNLFLIGKGIERSKGNELRAEESGFVRLGRDWIDLVPYRNHSWKLSSGDGGAVLEFHPGTKSLKPPSGREILDAALELESVTEESLIGADRIDAFISSVVDDQREGKLTLTSGRDARIALEINPQKTKAELVMEKGKAGGKPLSLKAVSKLINESGLKGIDTEKTKEAIMAFYRSSEKETRLLLCEGTAPERGKDRGLNFSVDFLDDSYLELLMDKVELDTTLVNRYSSIKSFPMDKIQKLAMVEKDQKIFSLSPDLKGKEGVDVYGKPIPGIRGNDPILNLYENIDYRQGSGLAGAPGLLEVWEDRENNTFHARIREHRNAPIGITLSENKMTAFLSIGLASGTGFSADASLISQALEKAGVKDGILEERIDEASEASGLGEVVTDVVVAEGKYPLDNNKELKLLHDIDYRDKKKNSAPVKAGEELGFLMLSGGDSEGYTVTGEVLTKESEEGDIEIGANIRQYETDEQDRIGLSAEKSGRLIFTGSKLFIQDTVVVDGDLSPNMGRIDFPGSVTISGTILSKSIVNAGENIRVGGVVQAALVSAGDKITIDKGIKGSQKAVVRATHIEFDYAEEANLMAVESIISHKAMMRCQVRCNGKMDFKDPSSRIVGGEIKVKEGLSASSIGNERGIETEIHFGQDYLVEDKIAQLVKDLEKIQQQTLRIDEIIEKARGRPDKQDVMMKARDKKVRILKAMEKKNVKLFLLREKFEEHFESSIRVSGDLHEGTLFHSHGRTHKIKVKKQSVEVYFDRQSGKIMEKPIQ